MPALSQEEKEKLLTDREQREYRIYMRLKQPAMAPSAQAEFFQLFLNGLNCEDIQRLNPNGFSLGAIVRARIESDWDELRREHQGQLLLRIRDKVQQIQLETAERVANELAASNRMVNDKVLRFLQTGDIKELEGTGIGSSKHLKESVELLLKLTGQDNENGPIKKLPAAPAPPPVPVSSGVEVLPTVPTDQPLLPRQAAGALSAIHRHRQNQGEE